MAAIAGWGKHIRAWTFQNLNEESPMKRPACAAVTILLFASSPLSAGSFDSGSDGSDGAFTPPAGNTVVDLSLAAATPPGTGNGYYDPDLWAVVFNYTTVNIPSSATVTFTNHPSGAPVIWLCQGNVTIGSSAILRLNGGNGESDGSGLRVTAPGGPGGFHGGFGGAVPATRWASGGYGPGGSNVDPDGSGSGSGGSHATVGALGGSSSGVDLGPAYGNIFALPLIGGSGGAGGWGFTNLFGAGGGGGGGAILIASSGTITVLGNIEARGGAGGFASTSSLRGGGGAGGAIRLMANTITGTGSLMADGSSSFALGGHGRIRVEADTINLSSPGTPPFTSGPTGLVFPAVDAPFLRATMVGTENVPADPTGSPEAIDVTISTDQPQTILIEATNIDPGTIVRVRVVPKSKANAFTVDSTALVGTYESSTATAQVTFPPGQSDVQLFASTLGGGARGLESPETMGTKFASAAKRLRYRRTHAIVSVETGPGADELTYTTATGRRVTYPANLFAAAGAKPWLPVPGAARSN